MMWDVVAIGELLIDFISYGKSENGNLLYEANAGGAPCNALAMATSLGHKTAFIGKVGADNFGFELKKALLEVGIDTKGLVLDKKTPTTLAFVHKKENGDRDFSFYRNQTADTMLQEDEIDEELIKGTKILSFGSLSLSFKISEMATKKAIEIAKNTNKIIAFDPNYRAMLFENEKIAIEKMQYGIGKCDILKIADNEIELFTQISDYERAAKKIYEKYGTYLIFVTLGKNGSAVLYNNNWIYEKSYLQENTIETTGAGDSFFGSVLSCILNYDILNKEMLLNKKFSASELSNILKFANAAASIITTRKGALRVMPKKNEIESLIN